jgi:hypothetical protein
MLQGFLFLGVLYFPVGLPWIRLLRLPRICTGSDLGPPASAPSPRSAQTRPRSTPCALGSALDPPGSALDSSAPCSIHRRTPFNPSSTRRPMTVVCWRRHLQGAHGSARICLHWIRPASVPSPHSAQTPPPPRSTPCMPTCCSCCGVRSLVGPSMSTLAPTPTLSTPTPAAGRGKAGEKGNDDQMPVAGGRKGE